MPTHPPSTCDSKMDMRPSSRTYMSIEGLTTEACTVIQRGCSPFQAGEANAAGKLTLQERSQSICTCLIETVQNRQQLT